MPDATALADWQPKYDQWKEDAIPKVMKGEAKQAFGTYPWFRPEGDPFATPGKAASETRFALITTGGYSIDGEQEPFVPLPGFDDKTPEIREIPVDVDREKLVIHHPGYDHRFAEEDINVNLPLDRLREMAEAGEIGSIANNTQVIMGLQPNVAPLLRETIPTMLERFETDGVEAALLVPS